MRLAMASKSNTSVASTRSSKLARRRPPCWCSCTCLPTAPMVFTCIRALCETSNECANVLWTCTAQRKEHPAFSRVLWLDGTRCPPVSAQSLAFGMPATARRSSPLKPSRRCARSWRHCLRARSSIQEDFLRHCGSASRRCCPRGS